MECGPSIEGATPLTEPGAVLLIGEMHGTNEAPEAVGRIACHAARRPERSVIVALEIAKDNQAAVDTFLASDGSSEARLAVLQAPHFVQPFKDGRSSAAMVDLLESIRGWRSQGAAIDVLCYDVNPGWHTTGVQRDAVMAESIVAARHAHATAALVVLSGNIHNRTKPGTPWDPAFVPMGVPVREAFPHTISLDFDSAGGTFWACMATPEGETKCGTAQGSGTERGSSAFVELFDEADDAGFDGTLYVGTTTASEPAVPSM
ncbi:MAG: hypothetical protein K0V04_24690 [Deltaproteobacteria bacterium]|nr:hypothetical protein [Deltaproteobacteria bacterium]